MIALWVALAGGAGAMTRFVVDGAVRQRWPSRFPWGTVLINVTGSFLLGMVTGFGLFHGADHGVEVIVGIGFCGGYTTFSTASVETVRLVQAGRPLVAAAHAVGSLVITVVAGAAGLLLTAL